MKQYLLHLLLLLTAFSGFAQVKGTVTDTNNQPLPFVNIFLENTYTGTTTNDHGKYELNLQKPGKYTLVFQFLGFKTQKRTVEIEKFPYTLDVALPEEQFSLKEVVINPKDNPADRIIREAIKNKKANSEKTAHYTADFYSRGIFRIKDAPKAILGQKLDMFDDVLDSTRSGILYLSETVSKIKFQKPDKMQETIIASKVSGQDNGFSFNNAASVNFDLYDNYLPFYINIVSPISPDAFLYYKFHLESTFVDDNNHLINKIKVTPKRPLEPVMEGYIYIVDDTYAVYACDLSVTGKSMQNPAINILVLKQNFTFNRENNIWAKTSQVLDFKAGLLGINVDGRFTYVYNNFVFPDGFEKKTFTREVLNFEEGANKKADDFWNQIRPVPLTIEESTDYSKKDELQTKKKSKVYLDSIDKKSNRFKWLNPVTGYTFKNSYRNETWSYDGLLKGYSFNTVQGHKFTPGFSYMKRREEKRTYTSAGVKFDYGLSEKRFRTTAFFAHQFNNVSDAQIRVSGGSSVSQFNTANPIPNFVNTVSTLFFEDNYMKLYERDFINVYFGQELVNGVFLSATLDYAKRKPLFNNTDYVLINDTNKVYTSNNPLDPDDYANAGFETSNMVKATLSARIVFNQDYWSRPDGKFNIPDDTYPVLYAGWEQGYGGSSDVSYQHIFGRLTYEHTFGNKGDFETNVKAGKFFNGENISFVDYKHFNGNETHVGRNDKYLYGFNLLPYYSASTNDSYLEIHAEHNDKGYIMNKIPLLNKLQSTLVLGYHNLCVPQRNPYHEFSVGLDNLGIGKFRLIRIDYYRAYQHGFVGDGVVFGLKFLNVLE
ncbi:DUF5686 and carboxypeptidase regulatory-like domain-containing protein [Flavobacterium silvaticum]|uniref:Carboxypeptidase-like regulatory domain-containing protein n=1 Tax=Flavobacterium silvaticum TaxID=1852020 RepID=A0A972G0B4_9FLAO|nr:DUF5686 and carboxypeptidase regulatory-like domain-containing protein [Flavobacterium silvaticum]NMH28101.1 carboxypeptidase-like regulatory domain-containing protein [Flavobacterium silvaticum]